MTVFVHLQNLLLNFLMEENLQHDLYYPCQHQAIISRELISYGHERPAGLGSLLRPSMRVKAPQVLHDDVQVVRSHRPC